MPAAPFEACDQAGGRVSSQSLVRYDTNDYSVPVAYGHKDVWIRGYVDEVVIGCRGEVIARHPRCYDREDMIFDTLVRILFIAKYSETGTRKRLAQRGIEVNSVETGGLPGLPGGASDEP